MSKRSPRNDAHAEKPTIAPLMLIGLLTTFSLGLWLWQGSSIKPPHLAPMSVPTGADAEMAESSAALPRTFDVPKLPAGVVGRSWQRQGDHAQLLRPDGSALKLTIRPELQERITAQIKARQVPYAGVVLMDPKTGAIKVWAEHHEPGKREGRGQGLTRARAPAASTFKIVTTAALLETGIRPNHETCYRGGRSRLSMRVLKPSKADARCEPLSLSLARSSNVPVGRLAWQKLHPGDLVAMGERLLFRTLIDFDIAVEPSKVNEGTGALARAKTGAGFRGTTLSPLHGAMIASAVANGGVMMRPYIVASDTLQPGLKRHPSILQRALPTDIANELRQMLSRTTTEGTGVKSFSHWPEELRHIKVAGKTGTLASRRGGTYRLYTWFIGFAPADKPEVAVAVLAVNSAAWRAKAVNIARRALVSWFELEHEELKQGGDKEKDSRSATAKAAGPAQLPTPQP